MLYNILPDAGQVILREIVLGMCVFFLIVLLSSLSFVSAGPKNSAYVIYAFFFLFFQSKMLKLLFILNVLTLFYTYTFIIITVGQ